MKFIHTSDWHLGHTLYGHCRDAEQQNFLDQLLVIVSEERPDALLISGDIFDRTNPSIAAQKMYCDTLLSMHKSCPQMTIVVTAGNHDSKSQLESTRRLWDLANVKVIGQVERTNGEIDYLRHIIEINNGDETTGYIVAIPHIYDQGYPQISDNTPNDERKLVFHQTLLDQVRQRNVNGLPVVMMAHLALTGSSFKGHGESIGGMMAQSVAHNSLGYGFDYLALGHIHCPQTLECNNAIARYCGTPIAVSFDEDYQHSVSVVTLVPGEKPIIATRPIRNILPLLTIPASPASFEDALKELAQLSDDSRGYIRLNILDDKPLPANRIERIHKCIENKQVKYCTMAITAMQDIDDNNECDKISLEEFQQISPIHIAESFYRAKYGAQMPDDMKEMLWQVITMINPENTHNT